MAKTPDDIKKLFGGKKVTLMGLGLLGRGVGDAEFFAEAGAELIITDLKTAEELKPSVERLKKFNNITYRLGEHKLEDFEDRDFIIRAPNAPIDSPFLIHAREKMIPVEMDSALFAKLTDATIIGITGTRGKSTTTHLIYEILKAAGKTVYLGGNERDVATLSLLYKAGKDDFVVLELDSWQLQGFEADLISPHVSVWTNFMADHMNYYHGDMKRYFQDKAAIARFQEPGDFFVTSADIKKTIEATFGPLEGMCITDAELPADWTVGIPGEHNRHNAAFARAAVQQLGIPDEIIKKTLSGFLGLPGRMEFLGEKNGIAFYNDSNATTPDATMAALATIAELNKNSGKNRPIILIAGGSDKELVFDDLVPEIEGKTVAAVFFKGAATDKITALLKKDFPYDTVTTMHEALNKALAKAKADSIIILSPGATSFGLFKNEYDRGDQFRELVRKIS